MNYIVRPIAGKNFKIGLKYFAKENIIYNSI